MKGLTMKKREKENIQQTEKFNTLLGQWFSGKMKKSQSLTDSPLSVVLLLKSMKKAHHHSSWNILCTRIVGPSGFTLSLETTLRGQYFCWKRNGSA